MKTSSLLLHRIVIVVLVVALGYFLAFGPPSDQSVAEKNAEELYRVITGGDAEVLKITEQSGLYKIVVRFNDATGRPTLQDIFVTRDGVFFTDRLIGIEQQRQILLNQSEFAQCLFDKNVRVFGLAQDLNTQAQLAALGAFSSRIYIDCSGQNLPICQQLNITAIPVILVGDNLFQGPQGLDWFEENAGCST